MSADQYAQEFECSFDAAVLGAYYAALIQQAEEEKRIGVLPWEPRLPVHSAWDLGIGDSTAIWFFQQSGLELRVIDYHENNGVGLSHYAGELLARKARGWAFGEHILPHDAEVRELGSGKSRVETLQGSASIPGCCRPCRWMTGSRRCARCCRAAASMPGAAGAASRRSGNTGAAMTSG
jgi:hypothetical protein